MRDEREGTENGSQRYGDNVAAKLIHRLKTHISIISGGGQKVKEISGVLPPFGLDKRIKLSG